MTRILATSLALLLSSSLGFSLFGCKKQDTDNPDIASKYRGNKYQGEIVTGTYRDTYDDQGKGIHPNTLRSIEDTISGGYHKDFSRCLEDEMAENDTRFMRSAFSVEFKIDTTGKASDAKVIRIWLKKQNAKGTDIGGELPPERLSQCIVDSIAQWVFDPAPEVDYVHTYKGQLGEAF